ncbi:hypothetical protein CHS0354_032093 [Potamilus streckersoni]|uniref:Uncharacterized protein n=1 Tax=Potamilus streckersoni TaxID=2493646 RepID=A0AAE0TLF8_9BIVA|nr:hypothetical protein CHS0354_032093 [Potamilus streckersoni]
MLRIVLALVLVSMVMGEGCCPYDVWEGTLGLVTGTEEGGEAHLTLGSLNLHVNSARKVIVSEVGLEVDQEPFQLKAIQDYNEGTEFKIADGYCTKKQKQFPTWKSYCIPDDAEVVQNTYIGAGSEKVAVKTYSYKENGLQVYSTVTARGCIPIVSVKSGRTLEGVPTVTVEEFSGITQGVDDPSVFDIPSICRHENPFERFLNLHRWRLSVLP